MSGTCCAILCMSIGKRGYMCVDKVFVNVATKLCADTHRAIAAASTQ